MATTHSALFFRLLFGTGFLTHAPPTHQLVQPWYFRHRRQFSISQQSTDGRHASAVPGTACCCGCAAAAPSVDCCGCDAAVVFAAACCCG